MGVVAQKVIIRVKEFKIEAYQLHQDEQEILLFTHRQIGEIVGKTKATARAYLKKNAEELPEPIKARIPERRGEIPLTLPQAAIAYWNYQDQLGNTQASALLDAIDNQPLEEFEIVSLAEDNFETFEVKGETEVTESAPPKGGSVRERTETTSLKTIAEGIDIAANWMREAGVDEAAIAQWKLVELQKIIPELKQLVGSAQSVIAKNTVSPTGMIASELAKEISKKLERKVTAAQVNKTLHAMGLLDWANPGKNRERKLTEAGKEYGVAIFPAGILL